MFISLDLCSGCLSRITETGYDYGIRKFEPFERAIGQKAKIFVPGRQMSKKKGKERLCVLENDLDKNCTVVVHGSGHPALYTNSFTVHNWTYAMQNSPLDFESDSESEVFVRLYHRSPLVRATVKRVDGRTLVRCEQQFKCLASGNPVGFYIRKGQFGISWNNQGKINKK